MARSTPWLTLGLVAAALGATLTACSDDPGLGPGRPDARGARLALRASVQGLTGAAVYTLRAAVTYQSAGGTPRPLFVDPDSFSIAAGAPPDSASMAVTLEPCLSDPTRVDAASDGCRLAVTLTLSDASGELARDSVDLGLVHEGDQVVSEPLELIANYPLTIAGTGGGSGGVAAPAVAGQPALDCRIAAGQAGEGCSARYPAGTTLTLTASGDRFAAWAGDCAGAAPNAPCALTMDRGHRVEVSFDAPPLTGELEVQVAGLPLGVPAQVTVTNARGFSQTITTTTTLTGLEPGADYIVAAEPVSVDGQSYEPAPGRQAVAVAAGERTTVQIGYNPPATGTLAVTITGLTADLPARVTVTGPSFPQGRPLSKGEVLPGLQPGPYTIAADTVVAPDQIYRPAPPNRTRTVGPNQTVSDTVAYSPSRGSLSVSVSGLPSGTEASIVVTGPNDFRLPLTGTTATPLVKLDPGSYTVSAASVPVPAEGRTYTPSPAEQTIAVTAGGRATATVSYSPPANGSLEVAITGLPTDVLAAVTVSGPGLAEPLQLTGGRLLSDVATGAYTITAARVEASDQPFGPYDPAPAERTVQVAPNQTTHDTVAYTPTRGSLAVTVSGLPAGTTARIAVDGPNEFHRDLTGPTDPPLARLDPGRYTVTASEVTGSDGQPYDPPAAQSVDIAAGQGATIDVGYTSRRFGSLAVTILGLTGVRANVTVTGPGGFIRPVGADTTLSGLTPGIAYTITADSVETPDQIYLPTPRSAQRTIVADQTARDTVTYAPSRGSLSVTIDGLPPGANADVTVTAPEFQQRLTASGTLLKLVPGAFTVAAGTVTVGGQPYDPTVEPAQPVAVAAGQSASAAVHYAASAPVQLVFVQQPTNTEQFDTIRPPVTVEVRDGAGRRAPGYSRQISLVLRHPLSSDDRLGGTTTVTPQGGVATFGDLVPLIARAGYTLVATSGSLRADTSALFDVTPAADSILVLTEGDSCEVGTSTCRFAVRVLNGQGGSVSGATVRWTAVEVAEECPPGTFADSTTNADGFSATTNLCAYQQQGSYSQTATLRVNGQPVKAATLRFTQFFPSPGRVIPGTGARASASPALSRLSSAGSRSNPRR